MLEGTEDHVNYLIKKGEKMELKGFKAAATTICFNLPALH